MRALLVLGLTACSYTTNNIYTSDADTTDVQVGSDAGVEAETSSPSPNAWVYDQPNLSLKYTNCSRIVGDGSTAQVVMTYTYGSEFARAIPLYICSTNLSDACDIDQLVSNTAAYYTTPTPYISSAAPNTLTANCHLTNTPDTTGTPFTGYVMEWYYQGMSPFSVISDCENSGGSLYLVMLDLYDQDFRVQVDKDTTSRIQFQCQ